MVNLDHPVVVIAQRVSQRGDDGVYRVDANGIALLEYTLRKFADDPSLPGGVLGLFALASGLTTEVGSSEAAAQILEVLARLRPELTALTRGAEAQRQADAAAELSGAPEKTAPRYDEAAPAGTMKVGSLGNPGMQMPVSVRKRGHD